MNFDFSDEQKQFSEEARRFLSTELGFDGLRRFQHSGATHDTGLYRQMAQLGWLGTTFPEEFGGLGLQGYELCLLSEEIGRWAAPVPLSSSICLAGEAINRYGSEAQKHRWLPGLAAGEVIATLAISEGPGLDNPVCVQTHFKEQKLNGNKWPVPDGMAADIAVVVTSAPNNRMVLAVVELNQAGVSRSAVDALDTLRQHAMLRFDNANAEVLGNADQAEKNLDDLLDNAAIYTAFEQIGGAQAAFDLAHKYVLERYAFGRAIGGYQAVKHKLADLFVDIELARSNAYYAAWALAENAPQKRLAAAVARVSAVEAYRNAARESLHLHGGVGYTTEYNCHWFYRRERLLAVSLGNAARWNTRLIDQLKLELIA